MRGGGREIRTPEGSPPSGFQDRRIRPLCHPSAASIASASCLWHPGVRVLSDFLVGQPNRGDAASRSHHARDSQGDCEKERGEDAE